MGSCWYSQRSRIGRLVGAGEGSTLSLSDVVCSLVRSVIDPSTPPNISSLLQKFLRGQNYVVELIMVHPVARIFHVDELALADVSGAGVEWQKESRSWSGPGPTAFGVRLMVDLAFR